MDRNAIKPFWGIGFALLAGLMFYDMYAMDFAMSYQLALTTMFFIVDVFLSIACFLGWVVVE